MNVYVVGILLVAGVLGSLDAQVEGVEEVYKEIDGRDLKLYVVSPPDHALGRAVPALVYFHGGGWTGGAPSAFNEQALYLASRGMVCILVEYRLLGKTLEPPLKCLQDARSAVRWVRSNASVLGVDPNRIAVAGDSAGGHLAACLGLELGPDDPDDDQAISTRPNAMILYNPVVDNGPNGYGFRRMGDEYKKLSPLHNVRAGAPPTILFIGTADKIIPVSTIMEFQRLMKEAGAKCDAFIYEGLPHSVYHRRYAGEKGFHQCLTETDRFLGELGWISGEPTLSESGHGSSPLQSHGK